MRVPAQTAPPAPSFAARSTSFAAWPLLFSQAAYGLCSKKCTDLRIYADRHIKPDLPQENRGIKPVYPRILNTNSFLWFFRKVPHFTKFRLQAVDITGLPTTA
jgi:hypothetical protein